MSRRAVSVVGIGDDGCAGLSSRALGLVSQARVLIGGARQLAFFPQFSGERMVLRGGIELMLERVLELAREETVCVLASGDPLFFGIGARIIEKLGAEHVEVLPHPSSVQWAFARAGLSWQDARFVSLHGRSLAGLVVRIRHDAKVALLTDAENSPSRIARHLLEYGERGWNAWVCENLSGPGERVRRFTLPDLANTEDVGPLNVVLLVRPERAFRAPPAISFLHEDAFAKRMPKNGLITKREVRLLSLAALEIDPGCIVWDVGAGSGSVAIEAARLAHRGRVFAVEVDPEGVELCRQNAREHGADNVVVVAGRAPEALNGLDAPDCVFVGGSKGDLEAIVDHALERMVPGGRLVVNAITLENASEVQRVFKKHSLAAEVTLLQIARAVPVGPYRRYEALNPIQIFAGRKAHAEAVS